MAINPVIAHHLRLDSEWYRPFPTSIPDFGNEIGGMVSSGLCPNSDSDVEMEKERDHFSPRATNYLYEVLLSVILAFIVYSALLYSNYYGGQHSSRAG